MKTAHRERGIEVWLIEPANILLDTPETRRLPMESRRLLCLGGGTPQARPGTDVGRKPGLAQKNPGDPIVLPALMATGGSLRRVPNWTVRSSAGQVFGGYREKGKNRYGRRSDSSTRGKRR